MERPRNFGLRLGLILLFLILQFLVIGWVISKNTHPDDPRKIAGYTPWSEEVLGVASEIPVQDGGRVKPLSTFARFELLQFLGAVSLKIESGGETHKISATEWLLDALFRPEYADQMPIFRIDDTDVFSGMGFEIKERRQRFSFQELEPGRATLIERGRVLLEQEENQERALNEDEKKITEFAQLVLNYQALTVMLDFARQGMGIDPESVPPGVDDPEEFQKFSYWIENFEGVRGALQQARMTNGEDMAPGLMATFEKLLEYMTGSGFGVAWIPPYEEGEREWRPVGRYIREAIESDPSMFPVIAEDLKAIEDLTQAAENPNSDVFLKALTAWRDGMNERAAKVDIEDIWGMNKEVLWVDRSFDEITQSEVRYYERRYFQKGLVYFLIAFVFCAICWIVTSGKASKLLQIGLWIFFTMAVVYLVVGIAHRSWIMGRPPVGNLYDTIPFITAGAVIVLGIAEMITRRRLLISIASFLGVAGLFMAFRYEFGDGSDNMDPLVAVLNSNYWLATHVVTVTLGYSGALVASFISQTYLHMRLAGVRMDKGFRRFVNRSVYGIVCFTLFFSLVGTVLGGIWANDSWGRFWGWDPKENGALLVVLWALTILHARFAGWMKDWALHFSSIAGGIIVAFSWWHVNMLGVGLHAYGFTEGAQTLYYFYGVQLVALLVGGVAMAIEKSEKKVKGETHA
ncbi:MAG: cytochrome c biogenesis protein [Akkermansiaceae bacterium]